MNPRRRIRIILLLIQVLLAGSFTVQATHIVGGEMNYRYLGNNQYEIRLTVYRDCFNGVPPFDDPASLGIFDAFNNLFLEVPLAFTGSFTIPNTINSPCFIPPTNVCYERTTYVTTVTLPPTPNGYQLSYQRCCRNHTIVNIISPDATGATYYASLPGSSTFSQNSNPVFNNWPPPFICQSMDFVFDHSATDADGDSIVYELCTPFDGATQASPQPQPPNNPPYASVIFQPPYSNSNLLGGTVPLTIDPVTGLIIARPNTLGQFVVGICAREFRNGIYLGSTKRDFQLNVVPCPSIVVAAIQYPAVSCGTFLVQFNNQSQGAGSFLWDFGVAGNGDTSTAVSPSFMYPDTGVYQVTLIAYSNILAACTDTIRGTLTVLPDFLPDFLYNRDVCTNLYTFRDTVLSPPDSILTRKWLFSDGGTGTTATISHAFTAGTHTVTLITLSNRGCIDTITKVINVPALLSASMQNNAVRCKGECNGSLTANTTGGQGPYTWQWNDPLNQLTTTADSLCPGNYQVYITDANGCTFVVNDSITEPDTLRISINVIPAYCHGNCIGSSSVLPTGGNGGYQYLWGDPQQQTSSTATGLCAGTYPVTVTDARGCTINAMAEIVYSDSLPIIDATADTNFLFEGQSTYLHASPALTGHSYSWDPAYPLNNSLLTDPNASPTVTTTFLVTVTDPNQCINTDTVTIFLKEVLCVEPELFVPNAFSPNNDGNNDLFRIRGNTLTSLHMEVYDRWGELMFETQDFQQGWNGTFKGKPASPGVYVYHLRATCYDQSVFTKKGNVTLLR